MKVGRFEFIPQHFPAWVRELRKPANAAPYYVFYLIIGWTWSDSPNTALDEDAAPYLHPVVVDGYGADVYMPGLSPDHEDWEITSEGPKD